MAAWLASAAPKLTFSLTLAENKVGSSNAQPTRVRSSGSVSSRMSVPSSRMAPPVTSASRGISWSSVVLPAPVAPTSASVSPGSSSRPMSLSTGRCAPG